MSEIKIIHVFYAASYHHVIEMIRDTFTYFNSKGRRQAFYLFEYEKYKVHYDGLLSSIKELKIENLSRPGELNSLIKNLGPSDKLVLHGFIEKAFWLNFLRIPKVQLKKVIWVCWGAGANWLPGGKGTLINKGRKLLFSKIGTIVTLMTSDFRILEEKFQCKNLKLLPYYSSIYDFDQTFLSSYQEKAGKEHKTIGIKIGNHAGELNRHEESFKLIEKFKNEDIKIITPLAYGPGDNKEKIKAAGQTIFSNKYVPVEEMLTRDQYIKLIFKEVDILVYNAKTQTGLFNLYVSVFFGKKLFLNGYNYEWIKSLGIKIWHVDEIKTMNFETFTSPLTAMQRMENRIKLEEAISLKYLLPKWEDILFEKNADF